MLVQFRDSRICLGADQQDYDKHVDPQHQGDEAREGAVNPGKHHVMAEVKVQTERGQDERESHEQRSRGQPTPFSSTIRKEVVDKVDSDTQQEQGEEPPGDPPGRLKQVETLELRVDRGARPLTDGPDTEAQNKKDG